MIFVSGCTIDYESYYQKHGYIYNKDTTLISEQIGNDVLSFPTSNESLIDKYSEVYESEVSNYNVYSSYYSDKYETLYITYDVKGDSIQTISSRELALMEEHLLRYFVSDDAKSDYHKYLKVVRIYPDYKSSACRKEEYDEEYYSRILGCADYNALHAGINLNGLFNIEDFFISDVGRPLRGTFAHEFGHVSTYYNMILKGDGLYSDYLKLRLGQQYNVIYPNGLPNEYDEEGEGYLVDPTEILADDYVELFYDVSKKANNDYYNYDLAYSHRNSLDGINGVVKNLKDDQELFNEIKEYYSLYLEKEYTEYTNPLVIEANGNVYDSLHQIGTNEYIELNDATIIALGEVQTDGLSYYRVILSNLIDETNYRREYSTNIGYILKDDCIQISGEVIFFEKYQQKDINPDSISYLPVSDWKLLPLYDFSYLIVDGEYVKIYNYLTTQPEIFQRDKILFE